MRLRACATQSTPLASGNRYEQRDGPDPGDRYETVALWAYRYAAMAAIAVPSEPTEAGLQIRVLGPLEVRVDGQPIVVDTRKALAILALLAVEDRPFGRDELTALMWPESDDESARGALRRTLSVLRTALGGRWLRADHGTVALDRAGVWLDVEVLATIDGQQRADALRIAASQARGPFLAGFSLRDSPEFDDWRATQAVAVERSVTGLLDLLAEAAEAEGDLTGAEAAARRRVDLDPLDETAHRRLMGILARSGDRAGAIRQYRACIAVLKRELDVTPLAETSELYEAIRDSRPGADLLRPANATREQPAQPTAITSGLPLVGRDAELARLLAAYRSATPDGRLALIVGEAGIGKSRLVDALREAIEAAGGRALVVRAYAAEGGIAYGSIIELLRAGLASSGGVERLRSLPAATLGELERLVTLPPDLGRVVERPSMAGAEGDFPARRARLLQAVITALPAFTEGPVPGLVVVEDAQWADDASRETLAWLAHRLAMRPMLVVITWRPEDLDDLGVAFAAALEALPAVTMVSLGRLDLEAVRGLAAAAANASPASLNAERLYEESEGLPLFIVEALAAGSDGAVEGPARSVRTLLRERLGSVGETAAQVMSAAAVLGRSFDLPLLRGTSGRSEEETITALEELLRRGIVRERDAGREASFDFVHARLRDAAYEATSLARRRLLHGRAADLLRRVPSRDPGRLVQLATHERAAGRDAEAAETFREAGFAARAVYANREAVAHLETALALGHPDIGGIHLALGEIRTAQGDYAGAIAALEAAAAVSDEETLPAIEVRLGRIHARRGDTAAAASHLDAAIEALEQEDTAASPARAYVLLRALIERAATAVRAHDVDRATAAATRALVLADSAGDDPAAGAAHRILGLLARDRGDLVAARSSLRRSLAIANSDPDAGTAIAARNALALVEAASGDHSTAIALLETALEACRRTGERHLEAAVENNLADQLHAAGRQEEAMEHLKRAVAAFADVRGSGELEPEIWKLVAW
jgi:DNA-binding SARP family transcriptional activator/tetratricopeptide (TPR) repeat protein